MTDPNILLRLAQLERRCARLEDVLFQRLAADDRADEFPALATPSPEALPTVVSPPWEKRASDTQYQGLVGFWVYWPAVLPEYQGRILSTEGGRVTVELMSWLDGEAKGATVCIDLPEIMPAIKKNRKDFLIGLFYDKYKRDPFYAESLGTLNDYLRDHGEKVPT